MANVLDINTVLDNTNLSLIEEIMSGLEVEESSMMVDTEEVEFFLSQDEDFDYNYTSNWG